MTPRATQPRRQEYQPWAPPMPSITVHSASRVVSTTAATGRPPAGCPPAQSGSSGSGSDGRAGRRGRHPARPHVEVADPGQRQLHRAVEADEPVGRVGHVLPDVVLPGHHLVDERAHERPGDAGGHGRHQAHPLAGQARRQHRDGADDPRAQPRDGGVALHHLAVGEHVRAADVEAAAHVGRHRAPHRRGSAARRAPRWAGCGC